MRIPYVSVSRMDRPAFYNTIEQIKFKRSDVSVLRITQAAVAGASALLAKLRAQIEEWRGSPYAGLGSPSSGFMGMWLMLQICDSVDVYGMVRLLGGVWDGVLPEDRRQAPE